MHPCARGATIRGARDTNVIAGPDSPGQFPAAEGDEYVAPFLRISQTMSGLLAKLLIGIVLLAPGGLLAAPVLWWLRHRRGDHIVVPPLLRRLTRRNAEA